MMENLVNYIILVISVVLVILVLLQSKGGGLGGVFGGDGNAYQTRRGLEKGIFVVTVILAVIFVALSLTSLFLQQ
jgi:preprotein translocase subunit SecG